MECRNLVRALFPLLASLACSEHAATEVLVQLHVEPELAQDATLLRIEIEDNDQTIVLEHDKPLVGATGRIARIPLVPKGKDPSRRYTIRAQLLDATGATLNQIEAQSGYVEHELRVLNLWFSSDCNDKSCDAGRTCYQGVCRGSCFETAEAEATDPSEPTCKECEYCTDTCTPREGASCGCAGDSCSAGECIPNTRIAFVAAGFLHTCASAVSGAVYCWGTSGGVGRLGLGAREDRASPTLVPNVTGSDGVMVSGNHSCALTPDTRYCWGENDVGQLGTGALTAVELTPVAIDNSQVGITAMGAGFQHTCGLAQDTIWCWGHNASGELGIGSMTMAEASPINIGTGFARVAAAGEHTCGLKLDGRLECWGLNQSLEVGAPLGAHVPSPAKPGCEASNSGDKCFDDWSRVATGGFHTCAIREGGALYCWGGNRDGQLGVGPSLATEDVVEPQLVAPEIVWSEVAGGLHFSCGLDTAGTLYCWGRNESFQLGLPESGTVWTPTKVDVYAPAGFRLLSLGENHSCAIRADRTLWCWGRNVEGQIGIGSMSEEPVKRPTRICF